MKRNIKSILVNEEDSGQRLDKFIATNSEKLSFIAIQKLLRTGKIRINKKKSIGSLRIEVGDEIVIPLDVQKSNNSKFFTFKELNTDFRNFINNSILYKDNDFIAVNKPAGFAVQGGSRVVNHIDGVLDYFRFDAPYRPQLLHRLDKSTSGILLLSRRPKATRRLTEAFRNRDIKKNYWALLYGHLPKKNGSVNAPLGRISTKKYEKTTFDLNGKESKTNYNVLWKGVHQSVKVSLVEFQPETGRKHQIRAHCNYVGCSIIGDKKYLVNFNNKNIEGLSENMFLHARELAVPDKDGLTIRIKSPIPNHMINAFKLLKLPKNILVS
ncbi:MAG: RluA family pseudouridine synthase [Alphaproteobacteria bacterium]